MEKSVIAQAVTVEEAVDQALEQLGVQQDAVRFEVLEEPGKKIFGLGSAKMAKVKVTITAEYIKSLELERLDDADGDVGVDEDAAPGLEPTDLSDEQIDEIADTAIDVLKQIATFCGAENVSVEEYEGDDGEIILDIIGDNLGYLIGRHGRTADALQVAVASIVTKKIGIRYPIAVDVEGYKHRRKQKVVEIALRAAERAKGSGKPSALRPMTPQERRIVHIALREVSGVSTTSEGSGAYRHVVIMPSK